MKYLIALLPFLVAPLLLPPFAGGLQMIGVLALLLVGFIHLIPSNAKQDLVISKVTLFSIAFITVITVALWFLFPNTWMFQSLFPSILAGWMAFILILYIQPQPIHAIAVIAVSSWGVLFYHNTNPSIIPSEFLYSRWNTFFADFVNPPITPIVSHPESQFLLHWQWLAYSSGFVLVFTAFFQPQIRRNTLLSTLCGLVLIAYSGFYIYVMGNAAFWVMAASLAVFLILYLSPAQLITTKNWWQWLCFLLVLIAGGLGWLDLLLLLFSKLILNLHIPLLTPVTVSESQVSLTPAMLTSSQQWQTVDWAACLILAGFLTSALPIYRTRFTDPNNTAAYIALAVSILLLLPLSPIQWLSHPVLWICVAGFIFTHEPLEEELEEEEDDFDFVDQHKDTVLDYRSIAATGIVGLLAILILNTERVANQSLTQLMQHSTDTNRIDTAKQTHLQSYYRPDIRAIYLTWEIQQAVKQSTPPPEGRLIELEIASQICSQAGFIPYLAIKRISDFYTLQGNSSRAVSSLEDVLAMHPVDYKLHEMLAERLFEFGQYKDALEHYRICVNHSPTALRYHEKIALAYKSLGAEEEYQSAMQIVNTLNPKPNNSRANSR